MLLSIFVYVQPKAKFPLYTFLACPFHRDFSTDKHVKMNIYLQPFTQWLIFNGQEFCFHIMLSTNETAVF